METVIRSPQDGVIKKLAHKEGVSPFLYDILPLLLIVPPFVQFTASGTNHLFSTKIGHLQSGNCSCLVRRRCQQRRVIVKIWNWIFEEAFSLGVVMNAMHICTFGESEHIKVAGRSLDQRSCSVNMKRKNVKNSSVHLHILFRFVSSRDPSPRRITNFDSHPFNPLSFCCPLSPFPPFPSFSHSQHRSNRIKNAVPKPT